MWFELPMERKHANENIPLLLRWHGWQAGSAKREIGHIDSANDDARKRNDGDGEKPSPDFKVCGAR